MLIKHNREHGHLQLHEHAHFFHPDHMTENMTILKSLSVDHLIHMPMYLNGVLLVLLQSTLLMCI